MKSWKNSGRIAIGMDLGRGGSVRRMGEAAAADGRIYLQFDPGFAARGINPSPIRLKLNAGLQEGVRDLERLPGLLHDSLPDGWARLVLDRALREIQMSSATWTHGR